MMTAPLRIVLWPVRLLLGIAIPAFLFAAVLHYSAGDVGRVPWDIAYLTASAIGLGLLRFIREWLGL